MVSVIMRQHVEETRDDLEFFEQFEVIDIEVGKNHKHQEPMSQRIQRVREDLRDIEHFYNIKFSQTRSERLRKYYNGELEELKKSDFDCYDQEGKIDYLLLRNYLHRNLRQLNLDAERDKKTECLIQFAPTIIDLCEDRQQMKPVNPEKAARDVEVVRQQIVETRGLIEEGRVKMEKSSAFRAAKTVDQLRSHLQEWFGFFEGYDPMFTWWVTDPYTKATKELEDLAPSIREKLVGLKPDDKDAIVGEPIGQEGLMADLRAEMIAYTPKELMQIGETEYTWCEAEMKKASHDLGYDSWRDALEHVKNLYVGPGQQPQLIHDLATEAIDYVRKHDLVTVPPICADTWRMFMMAPERQKANPFFLGGESILVSYPTDTMDHSAKLMSMRGNNIHFSRSTVFHELIPGHHLQFYMIARHRPYRRIFTTPFWIEGWSLYWEMILWDKDFPTTPENKIGMLFWRMHRCARIIFSLKFHLGQMTPQECIDYLVEKVGHERATAEGEVRRSFSGDYSPLYQAGYMLGALQIYELRKEMVESGKMTEKEFHDRVLREGEMPIELLRNLIGEHEVTAEYEAEWRFYQGR